MKTLLGIYIHLPLCDVKCAYCDFFSLGRRHEDANFWPQYLKRLKNDLEDKLKLVDNSHVLASIFFGGGTPSRAPGYVFEEIIGRVKNYFSGRTIHHVEISAEANPESFTAEKALAMFKAGVNRINLGIQSRDPEVLHYLGRIYSKKAYDSCLAIARAAGFTRIGIDLIHGVPGLSLKTLARDLQWALQEGVNHISAYSLTLEEGTALTTQVKAKQKHNLSQRRQYLHYQTTVALLTEAGFQRYEISNYAKPGYECLHNVLYWKYRPYIGIGVAAHSFVGDSRIAEPCSLTDYLNGHNQKIEPAIPKQDFHIGSVRLLLPQSLSRLKKIVNSETLLQTKQNYLKLSAQGYLNLLSGERFQYTQQGLLYADSILHELT